MTSRFMRTPWFYSDLSRPYAPGLVVHETLRRLESARLGAHIVSALASRLAHLATYR